MTRFIQLTAASDDRQGETQLPTAVAVDQIRNVLPRKYGKVGTRVVFKNGAALPVAELYPDVVRLLTEGAITSDWVAPAEPVLDEEDVDNVRQFPPLGTAG